MIDTVASGVTTSETEENNTNMQQQLDHHDDNRVVCVDHTYKDHFNDPVVNEQEGGMYISSGNSGVSALACGTSSHSQITTKTQRRGPRGGVIDPFPVKLYEMLSQVENDGVTDIVNWQPHGRCFVIHQPKKFVEEVMPKYFKQSKFTSFQRQVNLYGFRRLTRGQDRGGYYHELFLRGRADLCKRMIRTRIKGTGTKAAASPTTEPDFYKMKICQLQDKSTSNQSKITKEDDSCASTTSVINYNYSCVGVDNSTSAKEQKNGNENHCSGHQAMSLSAMVPSIVSSSEFTMPSPGPLPCPSHLPTLDDVLNDTDDSKAYIPPSYSLSDSILSTCLSQDFILDVPSCPSEKSSSLPAVLSDEQLRDEFEYLHSITMNDDFFSL